ncbi:MAG: thioredoxin family protein [Phycisphaerales bacterium]
MRSFCRFGLVLCASVGLCACEDGTMYRSTFPHGTFSPVVSPRSVGFVETFDDSRFTTAVLASPVPVVVDCGAPWCAPCRAMEPTVAELAREWGGSIRVGKLDVTASPQTAKRFGVSSLPAFLVFKNGVVVGRFAGSRSKEVLKRNVESVAR